MLLTVAECIVIGIMIAVVGIGISTMIEVVIVVAVLTKTSAKSVLATKLFRSINNQKFHCCLSRGDVETKVRKRFVHMLTSQIPKRPRPPEEKEGERRREGENADLGA